MLAQDAFVEIVVWRVPRSLPRSLHRLKYRLALIVAGECVLRYHNEAGKGDHRHLAGEEAPYSFRGFEKLLSDFWSERRIVETTK